MKALMFCKPASWVLDMLRARYCTATSALTKKLMLPCLYGTSQPKNDCPSTANGVSSRCLIGPFHMAVFETHTPAGPSSNQRTRCTCGMRGTRRCSTAAAQLSRVYEHSLSSPCATDYCMVGPAKMCTVRAVSGLSEEQSWVQVVGRMPGDEHRA